MEETVVGSGIDATLVVAILALLVAVLGLAFQIAPKPDNVENKLDADPTYRQDIAETLCDGSLGQRYRDGLARGLARLDHSFGPPGSASALGICIIIALVYAYAGFFLVWGVGGPGVIGGFELLPRDGTGPQRVQTSAALVILPLAAYWFGGRFGPPVRRVERRLVTRLLYAARRRGRRYRRVTIDRAYRLAAALLILLMLFALLARVPQESLVAVSGLILLVAYPVLGIAAGVAVRSRVASDWAGPIASTTAGAAVAPGAVVVAGAVAIAIAAVSAGSVGAAAAVPVAVAIAAAVAAAVSAAVAGAVVVVGAGAAVITASVAGALADAVVGAAAAAFAGAAAVAAAVGLRARPGAFPGAIGAMLGLASLGVLFGSGFVERMSLVLLTFFLVLPLINGLVDWGSWWVTRRLGGHLLQALDGGAGALRLGLVALGHGVADLVLAAVMLLAMAFVLALGFEGYNQAALWTGPEPAFDLEAYVANAAAAPFGEGAWLTLMLLTTLVPTFLHVAVVWMSPLGLVFLSSRRRQWVDHLERWDDLDEAARSRTRRAVAAYVAHGRIGLWLLAGLLSIALFAMMAVAIAFLHQGGFADYVAGAAYCGIDTARWLGGFR